MDKITDAAILAKIKESAMRLDCMPACDRPLTMETLASEIGDSLDRVEIIMDIEDDFDIGMPDDVENAKTIGQIVTIVQAQISQLEDLKRI